MQNNFFITDQEKCTGCFACMNICRSNAISVHKDEMGKTIPRIDIDKCIKCNACKNVCPSENRWSMNEIKECYAAWTKNEYDVEYCASGGISTGMARYIVNHGGVAFGSAFDANLNLNISSTENEKELKNFAGSKYVQSFTGNTFREVEKKLKERKTVYYVGTPCQIDGLKHFLRKDYSNLILIDLICHGVPPAEYLKSYALSVCSNMPDNVTMRAKKDYKIIFKKGKKILYEKFSSADYYYFAYLNAIIYRDNCYTCQYAQKKRCSDITLGDFWGIDRNSLTKNYSGKISAVLINTEKGAEFWHNVNQQFYFEKRKITEALKGNGQLSHPPKRHEYRNEFEEKYKKYGFNTAIRVRSIKKVVLKNRIKFILIFRIASKFRRMVKSTICAK